MLITTYLRLQQQLLLIGTGVRTVDALNFAGGSGGFVSCDISVPVGTKLNIIVAEGTFYIDAFHI